MAATAGVRGCWLAPAFHIFDGWLRRCSLAPVTGIKGGGLLTSLGSNTRVCRSQRLAAWTLVSAGDVAGGGLSVCWSASDMG
jgi:hypothetical protein